MDKKAQAKKQQAGTSVERKPRSTSKDDAGAKRRDSAARKGGKPSKSQDRKPSKSQDRKPSKSKERKPSKGKASVGRKSDLGKKGAKKPGSRSKSAAKEESKR
jgi:hypothetical protein